MVVSAPAGVGKSRLAREALEAAAGDGAMTHWAQATGSAASVPLGAFAGLVELSAYRASRIARIAASLLIVHSPGEL